MGRPRKGVDGGEAGIDRDGAAPPLRNTADGDELRHYIQRIESANEEIKEYTDERKEIFKEFKAKGYDVKTLRTILRRRAMDPDERETADALLEMYEAALGDYATTPLGQAGAERVRDEAQRDEVG